MDAFCEYCDIVSRKLGDRVKNWMTVNEPYVIAVLGHYLGVHAPGHRDQAETLAAAHHLLLAHGQAVPILRANVKDAQVGIALDIHPQTPASQSPADRAEAQRLDGIMNRWFLDPLAGRGYPQDIVEYYASEMGFIQANDMQAMTAPLDFLGINYYSRFIARAQDIRRRKINLLPSCPARKRYGLGNLPARLDRSAGANSARLQFSAVLHHRKWAAYEIQ